MVFWGLYLLCLFLLLGLRWVRLVWCTLRLVSIVCCLLVCLAAGSSFVCVFVCCLVVGCGAWLFAGGCLCIGIWWLGMVAW